MLFAALRARPARIVPFLSRRFKHTRLTAEEMANPIVHKEAHPFDKSRLDQVLLRRFFYAPAFEIYGGT